VGIESEISWLLRNVTLCSSGNITTLPRRSDVLSRPTCDAFLSSGDKEWRRIVRDTCGDAELCRGGHFFLGGKGESLFV
jgi:hypothetical protein